MNRIKTLSNKQEYLFPELFKKINPQIHNQQNNLNSARPIKIEINQLALTLQNSLRETLKL